MKKFVKTLLVLVVALIPMFSIFVSAYDYKRGSIDTYIKALGNNTQLCAVEKQSTENYSKVRFSSEDSEFETAKVWVMTSKKTWMSDKTTAYPNDKNVKIIYKPEDPSVTFSIGSNVIFWGEQSSFSSKKAVGYAYGY